jgi:hypothetical protein
MIKRSLKYLIIAAVNVSILTAMLLLWTDKLQITYNFLILPIEFLKILGFSLVSLISMRVLINYFRKKNIISITSKIKIASLLTFLISSYLYIDYSSRIIRNRIIDGEFRARVADKIKKTGRLNGTKADSLTIEEYKAIAKTVPFPQIPGEAENIGYSYDFDGLLPDYYFSLTYEIPKKIEIDTMNYHKPHFFKYQTFEVIGDKKKVIYNEIQQ